MTMEQETRDIDRLTHGSKLIEEDGSERDIASFDVLIDKDTMYPGEEIEAADDDAIIGIMPGVYDSFRLDDDTITGSQHIIGLGEVWLESESGTILHTGDMSHGRIENIKVRNTGPYRSSVATLAGENVTVSGLRAESEATGIWFTGTNNLLYDFRAEQTGQPDEGDALNVTGTAVDGQVWGGIIVQGDLSISGSSENTEVDAGSILGYDPDEGDDDEGADDINRTLELLAEWDSNDSFPLETDISAPRQGMLIEVADLRSDGPGELRLRFDGVDSGSEYRYRTHHDDPSEPATETNDWMLAHTTNGFGGEFRLRKLRSGRVGINGEGMEYDLDPDKEVLREGTFDQQQPSTLQLLGDGDLLIDSHIRIWQPTIANP